MRLIKLTKQPKSRDERLSYLDECDQERLRKACLISNERGAPSENEKEVHESFGRAITSTPYSKKDEKGESRLSKNKQKVSFNFVDSDAGDSSLSASKALAVVERKRREDAITKKNSDIEAIQNKYSKEQAVYEEQLQAHIQALALKREEHQLRILKEEQAHAAEQKQRQELQQQRRAQRLSMRDEQIKAAELQKKEAEAERRRKASARLKCAEELQQHLSQFSEVFTKICQEFKSNQALAPLLTEAKPLNLSMQSLIQRVKAVDVDERDVQAAKEVCSKINSIYNNVLEEVEKFKKLAAEKESVKNDETPQLGNQENRLPGNETKCSEVVTDTNTADELSHCVDKDSLKWYQELRNIKQNNEKLCEQILKDDSLKRYRFDCQKAVNIPVNAISPVNPSHLKDKLHKLTSLLSGQPVVIGDGLRVSAAQHPAGIPFCKALLAKKFVKQGVNVSSKPEAAFAIAAVIVAIWQEFPDWGQLLLAHFHHECPYLVPVFWPQLEGQSNKDYYLSLGYLYNEDGEVEKQDKFLKRMSGIMRLYAAILVTPLPRDKRNRQHPHDLGQGWRWLTSLLNLDPRPDICASLLYDFLEVTGSNMLARYGRQYRKLLLVICKVYFPRLQKMAGSTSGPVVRLETFLQTLLKHGSKPPQGMLPPNFW